MEKIPTRKNKPKMPQTNFGKAPSVNPMKMPKRRKSKMGADPVKTAPLMKCGGSVKHK